jgi:hypothetical protein
MSSPLLLLYLKNDIYIFLDLYNDTLRELIVNYLYHTWHTQLSYKLRYHTSTTKDVYL